MSIKKSEAEKIQHDYYVGTADKYNDMHINEQDKEHEVALSFMVSSLDYLNIKTILDIGSGTGRAISYLKSKRPDIRIVGIEPVKALRVIGYKQGISQTELIDGNALKLDYKDNEFDLVCEFGVLHHIKTPSVVVSEMLRVADKAIFLSDSNNFGQGSFLLRSAKQVINLFGLWPVFDFIKTKGKGYTISEGDGLGYSYSVFDNYKLIKRKCKIVHLLNTKDGEINPYKSASHVAVLGVKGC